MLKRTVLFLITSFFITSCFNKSENEKSVNENFVSINSRLTDNDLTDENDSESIDTDTFSDNHTRPDSHTDTSEGVDEDDYLDSADGNDTDNYLDFDANTFCKPSKTLCEDGILYRCEKSGSEFKQVYECDPMQGMTCKNNKCVGKCTPEKLGNNYMGCDYYSVITPNGVFSEDLGSLQNEQKLKNFNFAVVISNFSNDSANVIITEGETILKSETIGKQSMKTIKLPWNKLERSVKTTTKENGAYRIRSNTPITVYQFNPLEYKSDNPGTQLSTFSYSNDASILLPVNVWGREFIVASSESWSLGNNDMFKGFYSIVASQDNTTVRIKKKASLSDSSEIVSLNKGDVYAYIIEEPKLLKTSGPYHSGSDITGDSVISDKPVMVISGNQCANIPYNRPACDHIEEIIFPIKTLGREYFVSNTRFKPNVDELVYTRIIAVEDGVTNITYDPPNNIYEASMPDKGSFIEIETTSPLKISSNKKKIMVVQYMRGASNGKSGEYMVGDPSMTLAIPLEQYRRKYLFHAPTNYIHNFVTVFAKTDAKVKLDGKIVTGFNNIGETGYSETIVLLKNSGDGNHIISAFSDFGITVHGTGDFTSYWYPGGLDLKNIPIEE